MPRAPKTKKPLRKMRPRRKQVSRNEFATMKETHTFSTLDANTAYRDYQCSLARFGRASILGKAYREFRITKVEYIFKANVDTYQGGGNSIVPNLFTCIDKTGSMGNVLTAEQFRRVGARPRRFDDKNISVSYRPAVLQYAYDLSNGTNSWAAPKISPWLSCDKFNDQGTTPWAASSIDHLGLVWILDQPGGIETVQYHVEMIAHFQFRKPVAEAYELETPEEGATNPTAALVPQKQAV